MIKKSCYTQRAKLPPPFTAFIMLKPNLLLLYLKGEKWVSKCVPYAVVECCSTRNYPSLTFSAFHKSYNLFLFSLGRNGLFGHCHFFFLAVSDEAKNTSKMSFSFIEFSFQTNPLPFPPLTLFSRENYSHCCKKKE